MICLRSNILGYCGQMMMLTEEKIRFPTQKTNSKDNQNMVGDSTHNALRAGSDRFQVLVSLQNRKLGVAYLDGVEGVT